MLELLASLNWSAVLQIVIIDILLGGDNAVIIALACRNLSPAQRVQGVLWGTVGAIALRVVLISFAVLLLDVPVLKLTGGLLLLWIGIKLMRPQPDAHGSVKAADKLWAAVRTIIVADFVMSLDNVIAIAGVADAAASEHRLGLVVFGLLLSVPLIVWGSALVLKLLDRFPAIVAFGAALLGWIAGGLIIGDPLVGRLLEDSTQAYHYVAGVIGALTVIGIGGWLKRRSRYGTAVRVR
ncbi:MULTISPECIES: TerC family protein [Burkholderiaceae]|uniref:TerC family protein n=1 Tax=Burkholderiaceae TaxID=119060 RepID=UPI0009658880|nr:MULTISPECIES: TerC family protein [Burkholderiaceae]MCG1019294.1 TerC family protein [Mycetohabitans sp. B4]SIT72555.1 integral membrane protein, YjbE family [Burkholderia sp. b13]